MPRIFKAKEIKVVTKNKPGLLARVTASIAESRTNINACCSYVADGNAEFLFITADNDKVKDNLKKTGFSVTEHDVIVVETANEAGTLFHAAQQLAEAGIDLDYCYATAASQGATWVVFATKDIEKAMNVIP